MFWVDGSALEVLSWSFPTTETLLRRGLPVLCSTVQECFKCKILQHHIMAQKTPCLIKGPPLSPGPMHDPIFKGHMTLRWAPQCGCRPQILGRAGSSQAVKFLLPSASGLSLCSGDSSSHPGLLSLRARGLTQEPPN